MKKLTPVLVFLLIGSQGTAQSLDHNVTATAGQHSQSSSSNYQYTIGQSIQGSSSLAAGSLAIGFHQPALVLIDVKDYGLEVDFTVYPNPTADHLVIETTSKSTMAYRLHSANGQVIRQGALSSTTTNVNMNDLPAGLYQLTVMDNHLTASTAKIIKY